MVKHIRSDEKGAGLVLVLIVCSLVGAAALYLMDLTKVSEKKIANDSRVLSYQSLVKIVTNKLYTGNTCTDALKILPNIDAAFTKDGMSVELDLQLPMNRNVLKAPAPTAPVEPPRDVWFVNNGTSIRDVLLYVNERVRTPVRKYLAGSPVWSAAKGYILIIPGHPGVGAKLARGRQYRIPIFLYYSGSGAAGKKLVACSEPAGDAFFCTVMGGAYDHEATDVNMRCQPDRTCFPYKSGLVNNTASCPSNPPYTATKIGYIGALGDLYLCSWCNQNPLEKEFKGSHYYVPRPLSPFEITNGIAPEPYIADPETGDPVIP